MTRPTYYTLDGHDPVPVLDVLEWGLWFESAKATQERIVRQDGDEHSGWLVSTVFLGIDHNFRGSGLPILFETLIFAPGDFGTPRRGRRSRKVASALKACDGYMRRYATWAEAEAGHQTVVAMLRAALDALNTS